MNRTNIICEHFVYQESFFNLFHCFSAGRQPLAVLIHVFRTHIQWSPEKMCFRIPYRQFSKFALNEPYSAAKLSDTAIPENRNNKIRHQNAVNKSPRPGRLVIRYSNQWWFSIKANAGKTTIVALRRLLRNAAPRPKSSCSRTLVPHSVRRIACQTGFEEIADFMFGLKMKMLFTGYAHLKGSLSLKNKNPT